MASYASTYGKINASTRMIGMPHQLLAHNDPRLSETTDLGKTFAETIILEAPIIAIKPGVSEFLPGKNDEEKHAYVNQFVDAASGSAKSALRKLEDEESDSLHWFDHKPAYSDYMIGVNMICRTMAVLYGVDKIKVPWVKGNVTFGYYDWRYYKLGKQYEQSVSTSRNSKNGQGWAASALQLISSMKSTIQDDDQYVHFYVDANASFSESANNATTQSLLSSFTDKIEGMAKELSMVGAIGMGSEQFDSLVNDASGNIDNFVQSTPYGHKLAHFLNIGVGLAHILGLFLPIQMSANTFKSPYLLKCFSPGWFNASLAIGDSMSITKGGDGGWAANGLPNEVKVDVSIKDLYSQMYLPHKVSDFIENSGMIEFLMVNCAVDITNQDLFLGSKIWISLLAGSVSDKVTAAPFQVKNALLNRVRNKFNLLK